MKFNIFAGLKSIGGTVKKVEQGIDLVKAVVRGAKALHDDLDGDGKDELENLQDDCIHLQTVILSEGADLFRAAVSAFNDIKACVLTICARLDAISKHVQAEVKEDK
jgi:hypothetical protein